MTRAEWDAIPPERMARFVDTIHDFGVRCIVCGENLTLAERLHNWSTCAACWAEPDVPDEESAP